MTHALVTVAVRFERERLPTVERALDLLGNPAGPAIKAALDGAAFVHFLSLTAVTAGARGPCHLVLELNADGTPPVALGALAAAIEDPLRTVLEIAGIEPGDDLAGFLARHRVEVGQGWFSTPGLVYDGTPGMTVRQIRAEAELAQRVGRMLDGPPRFPTALAALEHVRDELWAAGEKWVFEPAPAPCLEPAPKAWRGLGAILLSLVATFLWPFLLAVALGLALGWWAFGFATGAWIAVGVLAAGLLVVLAGYVMLRRREERDVPDNSMPSAEAVAAFMAHENFAVHNHLSSSSTMKTGRLRRLTLRLGLWYAHMYGRYLSRPSFLGQHGGIHFARWILLPGTDQLLFRSNYDGTWNGYVEDFVELSARGVNGIWSNTEGFARTTNLLNGGANDSDALMRWTRRQQRPSHVWYSAYPRLTLARIRTNAAIRQGIALARTESEAADWLSCFGSTPRPVSALEPAEIPTLVYGGLSQLRHAATLVLTLKDDDAAAARRWLAAVEGGVVYGDGRKTREALVVALSATGLRKLGFGARHLSTFPVAFQHGMAAPWRARVLGDTGPNAPIEWVWGGPAAPADALLLVFAADAEALAGRADELARAAESHGHAVRTTTLAPLPEKRSELREPFGFADGISQPFVRGIRHGIPARLAHHAVEPGEMVLGYPDNFGFVAPSPSIPSADDPLGLLPAAGADPRRQRPNFAHPEPTAERDLGRNGSYLVVRQLEQHVDAFDDFARAAAASLDGDPRAPSHAAARAEWIKAKMVGRWKDGTSLVRFPDPPRAAPDAADGDAGAAGGGGADGRPAERRADNDFLFGREDPAGLRCPFGAHVRRTNPRDSFEPGEPRRLEISNRHRVLRVGRAYGEPGGCQGLMFMCLNADIERQFEFIQQTWLMGANFHGLENETDPTLGHAADASARGEGGDGETRASSAAPRCFTIPTASGPIRLAGLKDFVTVRGGGYFFLPSRRALRFLAAGGVAAKAEGEDMARARPAEAREERRAAE